MTQVFGTDLFSPVLNADSVRVALQDENGNWMYGEATTANVPSGTAGYAVGCLITATDTGLTYKNVGTTSSCTFKVIDNIAGVNTVVAKTNGTSNVSIGGTIYSASTVIGAYMISNTNNGGTVTVKTGTSGTTVTTITTGSTNAVTGYANFVQTALAAGATMAIVASNATVSGTVFVLYSTP